MFTTHYTVLSTDRRVYSVADSCHCHAHRTGLGSPLSPGPFSFITPRRRGGGGRWTSLHESTSVCPPPPHPPPHPPTIPPSRRPPVAPPPPPFSSHLIIFHPTVHPFTGYTSPLHRLNLLYSALSLCTIHTRTLSFCTIHTSSTRTLSSWASTFSLTIMHIAHRVRLPTHTHTHTHTHIVL